MVIIVNYFNPIFLFQYLLIIVLLGLVLGCDFELINNFSKFCTFPQNMRYLLRTGVARLQEVSF